MEQKATRDAQGHPAGLNLADIMTFLPILGAIQQALADGHVTLAEALDILKMLAEIYKAHVAAGGVAKGLPQHPEGLALPEGMDLSQMMGILQMLAQIFAMWQATRPPKPPVVVTPPAPPVTPPIPPSNPPVTPPTPPTPGGRMTINSLHATIGLREGPRDFVNGRPAPMNPGIRGADLPGDSVQMVGDRFHFDCTPDPDDPNFNETLVGAPENPKKPWVEPRWGRVGPNGEEILNWNGSGEHDHWSLESWEKKNDQDTSGPGLTPVLLMEQQFGPGQTRCFVYFILSAEHNNGKPLESNRVYWQAD